EQVPIGSGGAAPSRGSVEAARFLIISDPGQDEPGLGSASLLIALLGAEWGSRRRLGSSRRGLKRRRGEPAQTEQGPEVGPKTVERTSRAIGAELPTGRQNGKITHSVRVCDPLDHRE